MTASRSFLSQAALWRLAVVVGVLCMYGCALAKPNVIVMMVDDTSFDAYGFGGNRKISTPTLDSLAEEGVNFKNAYSNAICQPTRAMLMTGEYASTTGWWDQGVTPTDLGVEFGTFGHVAQDAGYRTLMVGKYQLAHGGAKTHGFDSYCLWQHSDVLEARALVRQWVENYGGVPVSPDDRRKSANRFWQPLVVRHLGDDVHQIMDATDPLSFGPQMFLDCIQDFIKESSDPFFIYFPAVTAHKDFDEVFGDQAFMPMPIVNDKLEITGRELDGTGTFEANVEWIDVMVKKLQKILRDTGAKNNTVVLFTGDNATQGSGKGQVRSQVGVHVPLVVWGGPVVPRSPTCELVSLIDVYATVADWTGGRHIAGHGLQRVRKRRNSISLVPFLEGKTSGTGRAVNVGYRTKQGVVLRARDLIVDGLKDMWNCRDCLGEEDCKRIKNPSSRRVYAKLLAKRKEFQQGSLNVRNS